MISTPEILGKIFPKQLLHFPVSWFLNIPPRANPHGKPHDKKEIP
jgi:hypothetical protein